ncbi:MAG: DUF4132 domain-containing protein, partial [Bifidobacteriaceae bacterium]|nr:DUF4132 domain-containing protein [Bifidobacteriaceae bacterium]
HEACREYATGVANYQVSYYQQAAKDRPEHEWLAAQAEITWDQWFEQARREKAREYAGSAIDAKGVLALAAGAPGSHLLAAGRRFIRDHARRRAQIEALVTAAAANPDPAAVQFVLEISRSFRQATVRATAARLADEIALSAGWTTDQLADRTIPTAGFDASGRLSLDFGPRQFWGQIRPSAKRDRFEITLADSSGQAVKALPRPGAHDHAELALEVRGQLTASKKELRQIVQIQTGRLREAMCLRRSWSAAEWREVMVDHPVMRHLAGPLGGRRLQADVRTVP